MFSFKQGLTMHSKTHAIFPCPLSFCPCCNCKKWIFLYQSYFREHDNTEGNDPQHPASHAKHSCVPPSLELQGMLVYGVLPVDPSSPIYVRHVTFGSVPNLSIFHNC